MTTEENENQNSQKKEEDQDHLMEEVAEILGVHQHEEADPHHDETIKFKIKICSNFQLTKNVNSKTTTTKIIG